MNLPWLDASRNRLNEALARNRLGHAPLVHGPAGLGKRILADWLVRRILCLAPEQGEPCGRCRSCELLDGGVHPDLFTASIPEDKTQLTVDVIRDLSRGLALTPSIGPRRVGLIAEADRMNRNAANALLKTLEEPSAQAWLILVSDHPEGLPATIRSRCQKLPVHPPDPETTAAWLAEQGVQATSEDRALAVEAAGGAPLRALQLLRDSNLAFGLDVRSRLLDISRGSAPAPQLIEQWSERSDEAWHWLAYWTRQWLGPAVGLEAGETGVADAPGLSQLWQQALEGRALSSGAIRADLLLGKWLLEWRRLFESRG